jgi:mannose-6-phosphate isomerase-like protein (cupin superfamily)
MADEEAKERRRIFVREVAGRYGKIYEEMFSRPRVFRSGDRPYGGGPQHYNKTVISPEMDGSPASVHSHLDIYVPGARSQRHAHMNSAVFYILEGQGYDVHDGKRLDWKAGDVVIVEPGCVHQHFNSSDTEFARMLVIKAKPLFIFASLLYQQMIVKNAKEPVPGYESVDPEGIDPYARQLFKAVE